MTIDTPRVPAASPFALPRSLVLAAATLLAALATSGSADEGAIPDGVRQGYARLTKAIETATMPLFMTVFHRDYLFEGVDGAGTDRGPWRRLWLDRFVETRFERVAYELGEVLAKDEEQVVLATRRVIISVPKAGGPRSLEEMELEDTWFKPEEEGGDWTLINRLETRLRTRGRLPDDDERPASPRLAALAEALDSGEEASVASFWAEVEESGTPLVVSPPEGDAGVRLVTFLWRGSGAERSVRVEGGLPAGGRAKALERLGDSDVWFRTERIRKDASFTYEFQLETAVRVPASGTRRARTAVVATSTTDPLNPRTSGDDSLAELPDASWPKSLAKVDGRPAGEVRRHTISSAALNERRFVTVYTPPGFEARETKPRALVLLDRGDYSSRRATGVVLDNLIAESKLGPTLVLMVHGEGSASRELAISDELVKFLGEELPAWARETLELDIGAGRSVIGGNRIGGELAVITALRYPRLFERVFVQSVGSGSVASRLARGERLPLRFVLSVGELDPASTERAMAHLHDVLVVKGNSVTLRRFPGSQHTRTWLAAIAEFLATR